MISHSIGQRLKDNWVSGLTVSLVSIPLSVSLAIAGGASPVAGIVTAIWAGLIASLFGGSDYNIVGPTGALSGILAAHAIAHGAETLPMVAIVTGVIVLVSYALRLAKYIIYVPANTIHGFTLGVAFTIGFNQLNSALGLSGLHVHERLFDNVVESFKHIGNASLTTFITFIVFLGLMFLLVKVRTKLPKLLRLPPAVLLSPIGILLGYLSVNSLIPLKLITLGEKYSDMNATLFIPQSFHFDQSLISTSITVAIVAILETILSAKIADNLTKTKHNRDKEILGLGLANIASGLAGGIPATAALARTALNVKSGANNKISGTVNAICIVIISFFLLNFFKFIPMAIIAAILVNVAVRMVEGQHFVKLYRLDKKGFWISIFVAVITFYVDPMIGILVGTALSLFFFLDTLSRGQFEMVANDRNRKMIESVLGDKVTTITPNTHTLVYSIKGHLTYVDSQAHIARFEHEIKEYEEVVLRLRELYYLDVDGLDAFDEIIETIERRGKKVYLTGVNPLIEQVLLESKNYNRLKESGVVFPSTTKALQFLGFKIKEHTKPKVATRAAKA
ncbi:MAG: SulP family inorganic anion transporter [Candidatus Abawacabacteria bacterium]|nr:SulP family inorganic anion transporter [Candidatus Abawacabacteria bacterium]